MKKFPKVICDGMTEPMTLENILFPIALLLLTIGFGGFLLRFLNMTTKFKERHRWYNQDSWVKK